MQEGEEALENVARETEAAADEVAREQMWEGNMAAPLPADPAADPTMVVEPETEAEEPTR